MAQRQAALIGWVAAGHGRSLSSSVRAGLPLSTSHATKKFFWNLGSIRR